MKWFIALALVLTSACSFTVVDDRTPEQISADRTRVAEAPASYGSIRISIYPTETPEPLVECLDIKGNISASGEKIYHMQGQANYGNTLVDKEGESWFCTEKEAVEAGFRKALR